MWDLLTIIEQNNRAAVQSMMAGQRLEKSSNPLPSSWPLSRLSEKLIIGPPLLGELINVLVDIDTLQEFLDIIRRFIPEYEDEVMSGARNRRVYRFCYRFSEKYFPLPVWANGLSMQDFSSGLPLEAKAMSYSAYHELDMRLGYLMLLSLVIYPYEGDERDEEEREEREGTLMEIYGGARVPLLDRVQQIVGDVVLRIPKDGWAADELHLLTDGTLYDGVGDFASWVLSETECVILDTSYDDVAYIEGYGDPVFKWTDYNVQTLADEWPKVKQIREKIDRRVEWLEEDPQSRFRELLDFLLREAKHKIKVRKKKKKFYDRTEHWCLLEQETFEEDEED